MSLYRSCGAIGALVGLNIAVKIFNLPVENLIFSNHIAESIMIVGLLGLLVDLRIIKKTSLDEFSDYIRLGINALIIGVLWEILSFSSLFFKTNSQTILSEWLKIAPLTIFLIGMPVLYISKRVSREKLIFGIDSTNSKGLVFVFIFTMAYTIFMIYLLNNLGLI